MRPIFIDKLKKKKSVFQWLDVWNGAKGDNLGWIDLRLGNPVSSPSFDLTMRCKHETYVSVRPIVVSLDVIKVGGGLESIILPIQPTHPAKDNTSKQEEGEE